MLSKALQAAERANQRVRPRPSACIRQALVSALRSACRACVEACPRAALSLDPVSIDVGRCDGCRLCVKACSSAALADAPLAQSEMIQAWKGARPNATFVIACAAARRPEPGAGSLALVCLAGAGWEMALVPLLLGASRVELRRGDCSQCSAGDQPVASLERLRERVGKLRAELGLGDVVETESPSDAPARSGAEPAQRRVSRRGLFAVFGSRAQATAAEIGAALGAELAVEQAGEGDLDALWLRAVAARLISRHPELGRARAVAGVAQRPELDDGRCTRCGICATACPSGAISRPARPGRSVHLVTRPHRCLGCERCITACPERAMRLTSNIELRAWSAREPAPFVMERSAGCRLCGGDSVLPGLDVCSPCRRARLFSSP